MHFDSVYIWLIFFFNPHLLVNNVYGVTCFELFSWKSVSFTAWFEWNRWSSVKITILKDVFSDTFFLFFDLWIPEKKHTHTQPKNFSMKHLYVIYATARSMCTLFFLLFQSYFSWDRMVVSVKLANFVGSSLFFASIF